VTEPVTRLSDALAGRYRIDRALGAGGMATVYLAEDLKHRRKVAIKLLREELSVSVSTARFRREIETAAQLQHPHILPHGSSLQQVLSAQVTQAPEPVSTHRADIPVELERVVMRCLEKRADDRWQSAEELLQALTPFAQPSGATARATAWVPPIAARHWKLTLGATVGALAVVIGTVLLANQPKPAPVSVGRSAQLTPEPGLEIHSAISPDGKLVAYAAGTSLRMGSTCGPWVAAGRSRCRMIRPPSSPIPAGLQTAASCSSTGGSRSRPPWVGPPGA